MKKILSIRCTLFVCLMAFLLPVTTLNAVVWVGGATSDVVDMNLTIDGSAGDVILPVGPRRIQAATTNVTVSLINNPVVVGSPAGQSQLYLSAAAGKTITVNLNTATGSDLTFKGSSDIAFDPLTIVAGGAGTTIFNIQGGNTLELTSTTTNGGVQFYLLLDPNASNLLFERDNTANLAGNATVEIGTSSLLSYLSPVPNVSAVSVLGNINFSPANSGSGRFLLDIETTGGFVVTPAFTSTANLFAITQATINRKILAGGVAFTNIQNILGSTISSSLMVVDRNAQLFDLLYDPFFNLGARADLINFSGSFSGNRYGMVLGANGILNIEANSYFDHVGTATDQCVTLTAGVPGFPGVNTTELLKARNPSAFFIDGSNAPGATPATIQFGEPAALFFRSGVDNLGVVHDLSTTASFTINPLFETPGIGFGVFDVEAPVIILDPNYPTVNALDSKFELLSLYVQNTGGSLFVGSGQTIFPLRTFATDAFGHLLQYNKGYFLINNQVNLFSTVFMHTDVLHNVYQKNDTQSEPAYIGGEQFTLSPGIPRPAFRFNSSRFEIHSNVALTGVDLVVPQSDLSISDTTVAPETCIPNISNFVFFYNGNVVDKGTGRYLNLGTTIGSTPCDPCCGSISPDAHLDVIQSNTCLNGPMPQILNLTVSPNDATITQGIVGNITGQFSIQTIFLGNSSNVTIGSEGTADQFGNENHPILDIAGNFFTFETRGGPTNTPELSNVSGVGGIFVDRNGTITIDPNVRAHIGTMVTKSANGVINLPRNQVYFDDRIGLAQWQLDMSTTTTIIQANETLSDYSLNWINIAKDYAVFTPYELDSVNACMCPPVTETNITAIPTILGQVNQLQVQGSRLGDQVHLLVDGGWVRELIFQTSNYTAAAANGVLVVENNGRVGIGSAHRNTDSLEGSFVLGVNGLSIIANGTGEIDLNEDMIINNICSILKGPDYKTTDLLTINADTPKTLRITQDGVLDLRSFAIGDTIQFAGNVRIILEAGCQIWMNGVTMQIADTAVLLAEPYEKAEAIFLAIPHGAHNPALNPFASTPAANPHNQYAPLLPFGAGLQNTDSFRAKFIGSGTFEFINEGSFIIPQNAFVGVETLFEFNGTQTCEIAVTDVAIVLLDDASMQLGAMGELGGNFQVGNTVDLTARGHSVNFTLSLQGTNAEFVLRSQAFFGLAVGLVDKRFPDVNDWAVDTTFNVGFINISMGNGAIRHDRTFPGNNANASLLAIGEYTASTPVYTIVLVDTATLATQPRASDITVSGGGNIVMIASGANFGNPGALHPVVTDPNTGISWDNNIVVVTGGSQTNPAQIHQRMHDGILTSRPMLANQDQILVSPTTIFNFIKLQDFQSPTLALGKGTAAIANEQYASFLNPLAVAIVDRGMIGRNPVLDVSDANGGSQQERIDTAASLGAVSVNTNINGSILNPVTPPPPATVIFAQQLPD